VSATLPEGLGDGELAVTNAKGKRVPHAIVPTAGGRRLLFEASVPAFGYTTYTVKKTSGNAAAAAPRQAQAQTGRYILENDMYRIVIDPARGGTITSLVAKKEGGKEFADPQHRFAFGELRGFFYDQGQFHSSAQSPATVTVLCDNELEKSVRISGRIDTHPFTQTITLRKGERKIGFDLKIDWRHNVGIGAFRQKDGFNNNHRAFYDDRFNLNILFPVALDAPALYKDAPFDVCKSTLENTHFTTWDNIKHNIILHWVDLAEQNGGYGLALLSDHTTSYSYGADAPLGLTVQYSGNGLWGRDYPIDGPTHIRFAVVPHRRAWDAAGIQEENRRWNEPLLCTFAAQAAADEASLIDAAGTGYEISAAYLDGEQIVVRLFNADGDGTPQKIRFAFPLSKVEQTDLNGNATAACAIRKRGGVSEIEVAMPRFGLKTLRLTK
jgi:alpha-mannosidase